ncbi:MAG: alpha-L-rhamnosidase [Parabacteroides sp.]|nr:alpha-L-rhamnosidase [Parabacteroides sp.]
MTTHQFHWIIGCLTLLATTLHGQQRDSRSRVYLPPTRIVWQQDSACIEGEENLLKPGIGQADLANQHPCVLRSSATAHPALLLDFGKELQGGLQFVTGMPASQKPVRIRVRLGESVSEAMCEIDGKNGATNDHAIRDFTLSLPWLGVQEVGNSGFRFARIELLDDSVELQLKEVRAISTLRDIPYRGSFRSNDERLNRIWQTGAYTVHLNMQEYLWDGVKRDRLVWIGDMHPEVMTINSVFGYNEVVPKSLSLIRDITPLPGWMNGISSYSIWWLLIQRDWYYYQGDWQFLKAQQPYATELLRHLISKVDANGKEQLDGNRFLDWPSSENLPAINAGLQAMMIQALRAGVELSRLYEDEALAQDCQAALDRSIRYAQKHSQRFPIKVGEIQAGDKQAAALLTIAGVLDPQTANSQCLAVDGAKGFSTFYGYYMLRAMAMAGNYQGALDVIRTYWGAMLDLGATTFWEDFNLDWAVNASPIDQVVPEGKDDIHGDFGAYCYKNLRHSLCHAWASGPAPFLAQYVLGVKVLSPGCRKVAVRPQLGDLTWAEGDYPTPLGPIHIRVEKTESGLKTDVRAPEGVEIVR